MLPAQHRLTERGELTAAIRGPGARRQGSRLLVVHARRTDARQAHVDHIAEGILRERRDSDADDTVADLVALSIESGHSRFPVVRGDLDDTIGLVHVKQALTVPAERRATVTVAVGPARCLPRMKSASPARGSSRS